jgi:hypothetical protein
VSAISDTVMVNGETFESAMARVNAESDAGLRQRLQSEFGVPSHFVDLAVRIWWDGKED